VKAGVYKASSIKVAEAAKVIENTQRDLNIAFVNELSIIFDRLGIDTHEVLQAAGTKWNFLKFQPGLVGGHCIGVDPYYLTHKAELSGYHPEVILAGRRINDGMGPYVARKTIQQMIHAGRNILGAKVNVLGMTFKENCKDIRNSKVIDVIRELQEYGCEVFVHDPEADAAETLHEYGVKLSSWDELPAADAVILAVAHKSFLEMSPATIMTKLVREGLPRAGEARARSRRVHARRGARVASVAPAPSADNPAPHAPFGRKLRVGVVADVAYQPRWLVEALAKVASSDFAELAYVKAGEPRPRPAGSPLWNAYSKIDQRLFGSGNWSRPADVRSLVTASARRSGIGRRGGGPG
jgi:hypothetical protein